LPENRIPPAYRFTASQQLCWSRRARISAFSPPTGICPSFSAFEIIIHAQPEGGVDVSPSKDGPVDCRLGHAEDLATPGRLVGLEPSPRAVSAPACRGRFARERLMQGRTTNRSLCPIECLRERRGPCVAKASGHSRRRADHSALVTRTARGGAVPGEDGRGGGSDLGQIGDLAKRRALGGGGGGGGGGGKNTSSS